MPFSYSTPAIINSSDAASKIPAGCLYAIDKSLVSTNGSLALFLNDSAGVYHDELRETPQPDSTPEQIAAFIKTQIADAIKLKRPLVLEPLGLASAENHIPPAKLAAIITEQLRQLSTEDLNALKLILPLWDKDYDAEHPLTSAQAALRGRYMGFKDAMRENILMLHLEKALYQQLNIDAMDAEQQQQSVTAIQQGLTELLTTFKDSKGYPLTLQRIIELNMRQDSALTQAEQVEKAFLFNQYIKPHFTTDTPTRFVSKLNDSAFIKLLQEDELQARLHDQQSIVAQSQTNASVSPTLWLTEMDIRTALNRLAQAHPSHKSTLTDVTIVSKYQLASVIEQTDFAKNSTKYFILNTGCHWTRFSVTTDGDGTKHIDYYDSYADASGLRQARIQDLLTPAFGESAQYHYHFTGNQPSTDGWSCGYHALAGTAAAIGIDNIPATDLNQDTKQRSHALRNWGWQWIIGKSYDDYTLTQQAAIKAQSTAAHSPAKPTAQQPSHHAPTTRPVDSPKLTERRSSQPSSGDVSLQSHATQKLKPFNPQVQQWLNAYSQQLGYQTDFSARKQEFTLTAEQPANTTPQAKPTQVILNSQCIKAQNTQALAMEAKKALAEKMVKLYIAKELGLKGDANFPSAELIRQRGIKVESITGKDQQLKSLIADQFKAYGIAISNQPAQQATTTEAAHSEHDIDQPIAQSPTV